MAIAVLGGCSRGETANETLPEAAPSSSETSEALPPLGPPDLPMPEEAREQTPRGVEEFAAYYISLINHLGNDLDAAHLRELSRNCGTCDRIAADADKDRAAGRAYRGGALSITSIGPAVLTPEGGEVAFVVDQAPLSVLDSDGRPIEDLESPQLSSLPAGLSTVWDADHWVVSSISFG
ncbi:DUF6318 family protein [Modestobacter sp. VKM Ac-2984]|uniref:DUF6318 family protein n=1 Tax=Modestobacter sp. VKM Ac-2984 TaxID=3004138 RepID=UPI0022AA1BDE|nr:DUF6318 family protein [Modestobacter sp. VKM Ac-2984]MCZ2817388.1 DUF6318 family protein [Modestobacter sp. VKM Ac-2984]